jgi:hypothetical protein
VGWAADECFDRVGNLSPVRNRGRLGMLRPYSGKATVGPSEKTLLVVVRLPVGKERKEAVKRQPWEGLLIVRGSASSEPRVHPG